MSDAAEKTDTDWRIQLTPEQYDVLRKKGTEAAFSGKYYDVKDDGTYVCAGCGQELFSSQAKYDSGSGWPSFVRPIGDDVIEIRDDDSHGMHRKEVVCSRCGGHLGHVFADGPEQMDDGEPATGQRYCINSVALDLDSKEESDGNSS